MLLQHEAMLKDQEVWTYTQINPEDEHFRVSDMPGTKRMRAAVENTTQHLTITIYLICLEDFTTLELQRQSELTDKKNEIEQSHASAARSNT